MAGDIAGHISEQFRSIWENKIMLNKNDMALKLDRHFIEIAINEGIKSC